MRGNLIDGYLGDSGPALADAEFLRRLHLDANGVIPTADAVRRFVADPSPDKRAKAVDARLADPAWADAWMGYWQDVLAENPGLLKPTLNNTGPFRRYLHNGMADNLPVDRFVTELVRMEGSPLGGGPAGFGMATQNDAPMAAKAHVLAKAFLAAEMKCARCHDAPFHPFGQEDLFGLAALLANKPQVIPPTSTVKRQPGGRMPRVSVSIEPGTSVAPEWNLADLAPDTLPDGLLPAKSSPRERLAALLTSPANPRFARVIVNRIWHRYMGFGLVEPVDDWDGDLKARHPELLDALARELMTHDYDLKHIARLILKSKAYQARAGSPGSNPPSPVRRRMSAEQILDSLFAAVGKPFRAEELCLDIDGRRPPTEFLNLGRPARAWQLALPSNERDRPALTLPVASSLTDLLQTFGWRPARPDPITIREEATTPSQPALIANGVVIDGRNRPPLRRRRPHRPLPEGPARRYVDRRGLAPDPLAPRYLDRARPVRRLPRRDLRRPGCRWSEDRPADAGLVAPGLVVEPPPSRGDPHPAARGAGRPRRRPAHRPVDHRLPRADGRRRLGLGQ